LTLFGDLRQAVSADSCAVSVCLTFGDGVIMAVKKEIPMSSNESKPGHRKIVEFIPYKTMAMDLESILASLARVYVSRGDTQMVELLTLCQAELFPVGSFDAEAERYEYVLKLAVPVKFHHHLRDNIDKIPPQLRADIATVTAPYLHEFISEVFVVIQIEQDREWREAAMDWVMEGNPEGTKAHDLLILCAPADEGGIASELMGALQKRKLKVAKHVLVSVKDKDIHHALDEFEKRSHFGVVVVSQALAKLPFSEEAKDRIVSYLLHPEKKCCQIWEKLERPDVASFHPALARSLAPSTARMTVDEVCDLLVKLASRGR
jgi:hypothetical protein